MIKKTAKKAELEAQAKELKLWDLFDLKFIQSITRKDIAQRLNCSERILRIWENRLNYLLSRDFCMPLGSRLDMDAVKEMLEKPPEALESSKMS